MSGTFDFHSAKGRKALYDELGRLYSVELKRGSLCKADILLLDNSYGNKLGNYLYWWFGNVRGSNRRIVEGSYGLLLDGTERAAHEMALLIQTRAGHNAHVTRGVRLIADEDLDFVRKLLNVLPTGVYIQSCMQSGTAFRKEVKELLDKFGNKRCPVEDES